jgi:hypothetical protein
MAAPHKMRTVGAKPEPAKPNARYRGYCELKV